jgi:hypothetical protein
MKKDVKEKKWGEGMERTRVLFPSALLYTSLAS